MNIALLLILILPPALRDIGQPVSDAQARMIRGAAVRPGDPLPPPNVGGITITNENLGRIVRQLGDLKREAVERAYREQAGRPVQLPLPGFNPAAVPVR